MVGAQENLLFLGESRTLRGRERINLLVHACRSHSLSFPFFFSSKIPLSYLFFSLFLFLNTCFLFLGFEIPTPLMPVLSPCTRQMAPFIMSAVTGVQTCALPIFVYGKEQDFQRERGNQPIGACLPL